MQLFLKRWLIPSGLFIMVVTCVVAILSLSTAGTDNTAESDLKKVEDKKNKFCISCHELRNTVYKEYQKTIHFKSSSGVRTGCSDCHTPPGLVAGSIRKIKAVREVWAKIKGTIDTPEKFEKRRLFLAKRVWSDMEADNCSACRHCHLVEAIDFDKFKKPDDAKRMKKGLKEGQTCINCHKGIAHEMPDMTTGYKTKYKELKALALEEKKKKGQDVYTLGMKPLFRKQESEKKAGKLLPCTKLTILKREGDWLHIKINGWQQDGVTPLIYARQGKRIFSTVLGRQAREDIEILDTMHDADTDLTWHEVSYTCWITRDDLIFEQEELWEYAAQMYSASCSACHSAPSANHFRANQWMGTLKTMTRNTNLSKEEYRLLLKYLQFHAKDTGGEHH